MAAAYKQDLPPAGGYPKIHIARNLPKRGPSGLVMMLGGVAVMTAGLYVVGGAIEKEGKAWVMSLLSDSLRVWTYGHIIMIRVVSIPA